MSDKIRTMKRRLERFYKLDSKPLHAQWLFWYALIGPLIAALYVFLHTFNGVDSFWSVANQEEILNDSKIALLIAALSPIITTIITNVHRTIQTNTQILATNKKNVVDAFITHQKVCIENLNHIQDKSTIELIPTEDAIVIRDWPEENRSMLTDAQVRDKYTVFDLEYSHIKLNLIYAEFFPQNNLAEGVKSYEPKNIIPSIRNLVDSMLNELLHDEPYVRISAEIDKWDISDLRTLSGPFPSELRREIGSLNDKSFRIEMGYMRERPQLALTHHVAKVNHLLAQYYTEVDISVDGKPVKENIFDILFGDAYKVEMRDISSYISDSILHILEINVAMGGRGDIFPIVKRVKVMDRIVSSLEHYLHNRIL